MTHRLFLAVAATLAFFLPMASAEAQRGRDDWRPDNRTDWEPLGTVEIGTRLERDVIEVGRREGRFQSLGFTVSGGDARIEDLTIVYGGGESEVLRVREVIKSGTRSRPIDLGRGGSIIQRIEITYRAFGPVKIDFFGEKRRERESWAELGCQRVGFLETKDVIRVGRREGAFRALKLTVRDGTIRLNRIRVVFGDKSSQVLDVRAAIPKGTETRAIDLDGRRRTIDRIELDYLPSLNLKRGPELCVLALEAGGPGGFGGPPGGPRR